MDLTFASTSAEPYCVQNKILATPLLTAWGCATRPRVQTVLLTYDGMSISSRPSFNSISYITVTPSVSTTSSAAPTSSSSDASGGSGGSSGSGTPVGAIAGGAVGGFFGLAAIVGLIVFFVLRRKRHTQHFDDPPQPPVDAGPLPEFHGPMAGGAAGAAAAGHEHKPSMTLSASESPMVTPSVSTAMGSPSWKNESWKGDESVGMRSAGLSEVDGQGVRPLSDAGYSLPEKR